MRMMRSGRRLFIVIPFLTLNPERSEGFELSERLKDSSAKESFGRSLLSLRIVSNCYHFTSTPRFHNKNAYTSAVVASCFAVLLAP